MPKTIIHVNRYNIAFNAKIGKPLLPSYIVRKGNKSTYAYAVEVLGPSTLVDARKHKPLKCGARAWIETESEVKMTKPMLYSDVEKLKNKYMVKND